MTTVYGKPKRAFNLGAKIAEGGEGSIYLVEGQPQLLAKLHAPHRLPPEAKLAWMVDNPPVDPTIGTQRHISIAWPRTLLYDASGRFCGFLMPYVRDTIPLLRVFNPKLRAKAAPDFNWRYLHRTARNLASAMSAIHASNYVVGDINDGNVVVNRRALVTVIDVDSFQVTATEGRTLHIYPCPVGQPEYTPGELQGVAFASRARGPEHDAFAMAVLFFQLLMNGNHPFKVTWTGSAGEPPPLEQRIVSGLFPYQTPTLPGVAPPKNAPSFDILHPELAYLFKRCFVDGHLDHSRRPTAEAWTVALETAERALVDCSHGHVYSSHQRFCPWCPQALRSAPGAVKGTQAPLPATKLLTATKQPIPPAPKQIFVPPKLAATPSPTTGIVTPTAKQVFTPPSSSAAANPAAQAPRKVIAPPPAPPKPPPPPARPAPPEPPTHRKRTVALALTVVVAGAFLFNTFYNGTGQTAATPDLEVVLTCHQDPEMTRIDNVGTDDIEIISIETLYDVKNYEPIEVNRTLGAGRTVIFRSGAGATSGTILTTSYIYTNGVYERDGVRIVTSEGTVTQRCPTRSQTMLVNPDGIPAAPSDVVAKLG